MKFYVLFFVMVGQYVISNVTDPPSDKKENIDIATETPSDKKENFDIATEPPSDKKENSDIGRNGGGAEFVLGVSPKGGDPSTGDGLRRYGRKIEAKLKNKMHLHSGEERAVASAETESKDSKRVRFRRYRHEVWTKLEGKMHPNSSQEGKGAGEKEKSGDNLTKGKGALKKLMKRKGEKKEGEEGDNEEGGSSSSKNGSEEGENAGDEEDGDSSSSEGSSKTAAVLGCLGGVFNLITGNDGEDSDSDSDSD